MCDNLNRNSSDLNHNWQWSPQVHNQNHTYTHRICTLRWALKAHSRVIRRTQKQSRKCAHINFTTKSNTFLKTSIYTPRRRLSCRNSINILAGLNRANHIANDLRVLFLYARIGALSVLYMHSHSQCALWWLCVRSRKSLLRTSPLMRRIQFECKQE